MGEENLDVLVERFIAVEERNFAQFNFVNEQNNEVERIKEQISEVHREIEDFRSQESQEDLEQQTQLRKMETQQKEAAEEAEQLQGKIKALRKVLEQLKSGIRSLFTELCCDGLTLDELLGGLQELRDRDVALYLGLIEQRAYELLAMHSYLDSKDYDKPYNPVEAARLLLGQASEFPSPPFPLRPPTAG
uniref:ODAD1 central coiled coil region domain-containing protein n=1 Tax=Sphenodon punctatus TaxID=8508 RepID=A0A8D0GXY7_SPHPU